MHERCAGRFCGLSIAVALKENTALSKLISKLENCEIQARAIFIGINGLGLSAIL